MTRSLPVKAILRKIQLFKTLWPRRHKYLPGLLAAVLFLAGVILCGQIHQRGQLPESIAAETQPTQSSVSKTQPRQIAVQGKLFCSLKRNVIMPFRGIVTSLKVQSGQQVKHGEILLRYRLPPDVIQQIRRRLDPPQISDLQARLADLDKAITSLDVKLKEARQLADANMASSQSVQNLELERQFLSKNRAALQGRLKLETAIAKDDLTLLRDQLGKAVKSDEIPQEASLVAPISGHVIGIHPEVRDGAELASGTPALVIGILDPMLMKTQIHEHEAVRIRFGQEAEVVLESIPTRTFPATVSRLSWSPLTPEVEQPSYYEVELDVPNTDLSLREGLKGIARFHPGSGQSP